MIRSMTGFGDASRHHEGVHYLLEVRSLNNKYFKASLRLPEHLQPVEAELESALRRRLTRGSIVCTVKCSDASADAAAEINHRALSRYVEQLRSAPEVADGTLPIDLGALLTLPGVLQPPADEESRLHQARSVLLQLLDEACAHLVSMREREGAMLREDLMSHHAAITARLGEIAAIVPGVVDDYQQRLRQRVDALLEEVDRRIDPADLIKEVAIFAERTDVAEETSRLAAHLEQFEELLAGDGGRPVGRTLDFLAQEMLREANTIASKSPDARISRAIVEVKGGIDRIKEQVQNIE